MNSRDEQTYWLIPRKATDPAYSDATLHRALLTSVVLFSGPALISDSATVRNRFLRKALRADIEGSGDGFMRELVDREYIRFAMRERNGVLMSLAETAEDIASRTGPFLVGNEPLGDTAEFRYIEDHSDIIPYKFEGASERYQRQTLRVFRDNAFPSAKFPETYRRILVSVLEEYVDSGTFFGLSDFRRDSKLWQQLVRRAGNRTYLYDRYGAFVHAVARGPYTTLFPETLGINPTYSSDDKIGIEYWRGACDDDAETSERYTIQQPMLGLVDFVAGLTALSANDIYELRNSDERLAYEQSLQLLAMKLSGWQDMVRAQAAYRRRIDDRIMARRSGLISESRTFEGNVGFVRPKGTSAVRKILIDFAVERTLDWATFGLLSGFGSFIRYVWDRDLSPADRRSAEHASALETARKQLQAAEAEKTSAIGELEQSDDQKIALTINVDRGRSYIVVDPS